MAVRTLDRAPGMLGLYAQAAAPLLPGSSLLPFIAGGGREIPELELELPGVHVDTSQLAAYAHVCSLTMREWLPATYLHVLAFPLHMALMTDSSFPFGAIGLVHIANTITQHRPVHVEEELKLSVRASALEPHPRGRTFSIISEARAGDELVWEDLSTMLRRGGSAHGADVERQGSEDAGAQGDGGAGQIGGGERRGDEGQHAGGADVTSNKQLPPAAEWTLPGDLGRRYAAVSGDRNPIHLHALSAKAFGFPRAIAHGMWTKARCLAALEQLLPGAYTVSVRFRRPILLPAKVAFASADDGPAVDFSVSDLRKGTPHLDGRLEPVAQTKPSKRGRGK